jgi:phosphatidylglycerophosphate synthase
MCNFNGKSNRAEKINEVLDSISRDRARTNFFRKYEQKALAYLVQVIPDWMSSNMLTAIGFCGSIIVAAAFVLSLYFSRYFMLLGVLGFTISWFGDSLDGRVAYFRNKPRKLYGFTLDITIDWISIILIGMGYIIYTIGVWELLGYGFVVMYGWEMIIKLMGYKITGQYSIDSGKLGPTEVRIIISAVMIAEVLFRGSIDYSAMAVCLILFIVNVVDTHRLLKIADGMDKKNLEKES